ncbi:MAG: hypothetical protein D6753_02460 [Planctomycetota bacterium]|nr:MAG: hypothetical protein D6753_02460 [Planctomycetota bacterium]
MSLQALEEKIVRLEKKLEKLEHDVAEHLREAVRGEDAPLEEKAPRVSWALVWFAYPIALILFTLGAAAGASYYWTH